jgi:hypothetical protein
VVSIAPSVRRSLWGFGTSLQLLQRDIIAAIGGIADAKGTSRNCRVCPTTDMSTFVGFGFFRLPSNPENRYCSHKFGGSSGESRLNGRVLVCEVSAMSQDKTIPITVSAVRADDYSPDGKNVIISLTTSYSTAERKYSVPIECLADLIVDLRRLNAAASATSIETPIQPAVAPNRADDLNRLTIAV